MRSSLVSTCPNVSALAHEILNNRTRAIGGETEQAETATKAAIEAVKRTASVTIGFSYI